ncbi:MAG: chromate efflux transporter [Gammaproteobacteria bacterium]|nr:MAG: chromate efflux transporter [Gammaproteobacteria bacterium]
MIDGLFAARWQEVVRGFLKIGAMSYGGPAIMGLMQTEFQEKRAWLSKERFLEGLALVNMLPGAGATQLGIYLGYVRAGWWSGLLAGLCFIAPAFVIMLALTAVYAEYGALPVAKDVFYGLGPVVVGIFAVAVYRLGRNAVGDAWQGGFAIGAALLAAFSPFGIVATLLLAGALGVARYAHRRAGILAAITVVGTVGLAHWAGGTLDPAALTLVAGGQAGLADIALFFFGVGAFTFGGGLSMLAFMQDQVVNQLHWLTDREFLDGLALGQLTPGPILMVASFVGYKLAGVTGALVAAVAIFLPSFVLMLSVLPWMVRIKEWGWMKAALKGIGPAVIGLLTVALGDMLPAAVTDVFTALLLLGGVAALLIGRAGPLPPMMAGAVAGLFARFVR